MTPRSPGAFLLSATFHALVAGAVIILSLESCEQDQPKPHIIELVAGEGDNYAATEAPALGSPEGVKLDVPAMAAPKPEPTPEPPKLDVPPEPAPEPTPEPPTPPAPKPVAKPVETKPAPKAVPTTKPAPSIAKQIRTKVMNAEARVKRELARQRAAEEARRKAAEKAAAAKSASATKFSRIDTKGISKGVLGGSTENTKGGAGGTALSRDAEDVLDAYYALLKQRVTAQIDKPPGLSDSLVVTVTFHISAAGRISNVHVTKSSGNEEYDHAVLAAFGRVTMPEHPAHKAEELELDFRTKDEGEG